MNVRNKMETKGTFETIWKTSILDSVEEQLGALPVLHQEIQEGLQHVQNVIEDKRERLLKDIQTEINKLPKLEPKTKPQSDSPQIHINNNNNTNNDKNNNINNDKNKNINNEKNNDEKSQPKKLVTYELSDLIRDPPETFDIHDYFNLFYSGAIPNLKDDLECDQQYQDLKECFDKLLKREMKKSKFDESQLDPSELDPSQLDQLNKIHELLLEIQTENKTNKNNNNEIKTDDDNLHQESQPETEFKKEESTPNESTNASNNNEPIEAPYTTNTVCTTKEVIADKVKSMNARQKILSPSTSVSPSSKSIIVKVQEFKPKYKCFSCNLPTYHVDCDTCKSSICQSCDIPLNNDIQAFKLLNKNQNCINCSGTYDFTKLCYQHKQLIWTMRNTIMKLHPSILRCRYGTETPSLQQLIDVCFKPEKKVLCVGCFHCDCDYIIRKHLLDQSLQRISRPEYDSKRLIIMKYSDELVDPEIGKRTCLSCSDKEISFRLWN